MSKNEFDELLLKKLQGEELEYDPAHWDQMARLLPPTLAPASEGKRTGKKWPLAAGIAAAVAAVLFSVFLMKQTNHSTEPSAPATALTENPGNAGATVPQQTEQTAGPNMPPDQSNTPASPVRQHTAMQRSPQQQPPTTPASLPAVVNDPPPAAQHPVPVVPGPAIAIKPEPARENQYQSPSPQPGTTETKQEVSPAYAYNHYNSASAFYEGRNPGAASNKKTSVSLGGGVNYGNLNTGYTAGVSVRRKVAGDFFVDGTVAMMYNNNASNVAVNNGPPLSDNTNTAARPNAFNNETTLAAPALDPIQKLYYVQFNPSIGYQVEKHVALSVGGDFQQILNRKGEQDEIVQPGTNSSKVFPNFDVGLTAKSEFAITPSIQAGLVYREGLNNMLKSEGSKYVNRRYIQVQFKYSLPVN